MSIAGEMRKRLAGIWRKVVDRKIRKPRSRGSCVVSRGWIVQRALRRVGSQRS